MPFWNDLHDPHTHKKDDIILADIFDTSHDILTWVKKEEMKIEKFEHKIEKKHTWVKKLRALVHFVLLTSIIFFGLLLISNWSAYSAFAKSIIAPEALQTEKKQIESGIAQTEVTDSSTSASEIKEARKQKILQRHLEKTEVATQNLGIEYFNQDAPHVSLSMNIAPYEDRIIIPKIGKNVPLVNVEHEEADTSSDWNKIFMKELENGVVKYPGSADPGKPGNSFIFGHSSNYPWAKGDYNQVFALLNELDVGDDVIVYFHQKKFVYTVREKMVVKPGHISSIGGSDDSTRLTLMTCWPLGTALNRLLVVSELKEESTL